MNQDQLLELLNESIPEPDRVTGIDTSTPGAVSFLWRGLFFKVTADLSVTEVFGAKTSLALLLQALLRTSATRTMEAAS